MASVTRGLVLSLLVASMPLVLTGSVDARASFTACRSWEQDSSLAAQRAYRDCRVQETRGSAAGPVDDRSAAVRLLGAPSSGLPWHSGAWVGGRFSRSGVESFGQYRGRPVDVVTTYSPQGSYKLMTEDVWSIDVWQGFRGRLNYGLGLLPNSGEGSLRSIARGQQDEVWRAIARNLEQEDRGNSIVRVGWESNLPDWRWQVTTANAETYRAAYRRVVEVMRAEAPGLLFEFGVACGAGLSGSADRLAPLHAVYPGDDVVDLVGCDIYDWYGTHAESDQEWRNVLQPAQGPGIEDVVEFARSHGKGASFGEWGLAKKAAKNNGGGDNPYYVEAMFNFFQANQDVVAFESYFDEPDRYIANSLSSGDQNPRASEMYARLW